MAYPQRFVAGSGREYTITGRDPSIYYRPVGPNYRGEIQGMIYDPADDKYKEDPRVREQWEVDMGVRDPKPGKPTIWDQAKPIAMSVGITGGLNYLGRTYVPETLRSMGLLGAPKETAMERLASALEREQQARGLLAAKPSAPAGPTPSAGGQPVAGQQPTPQGGSGLSAPSSPGMSGFLAPASSTAGGWALGAQEGTGVVSNLAGSNVPNAGVSMFGQGVEGTGVMSNLAGGPAPATPAVIQPAQQSSFMGQMGGAMATLGLIGQAYTMGRQLWEQGGKEILSGEAHSEHWIDTGINSNLVTSWINGVTSMLGLGTVGSWVSGGKGEEQLARDAMRNRLKDTGLADYRMRDDGSQESHHVQLADGTWVDIGIDGGNSSIESPWEGFTDPTLPDDMQGRIRPYNLDLTNEQAQLGAYLLNPLMAILSGGGDPQSNMVGYMTNAAMTNGQLRENITHWYNTTGANREGLHGEVDRMLSEGNIDQWTAYNYHRGLDHALDGTDPDLTFQGIDGVDDVHRAAYLDHLARDKEAAAAEQRYQDQKVEQGGERTWSPGMEEEKEEKEGQ